MNQKNLEPLLDQVEKQMAHCHYGRAATLLRGILPIARSQGNLKLHHLISETLNEARRCHILSVMRMLKSIRAITAGKEQSL